MVILLIYTYYMLISLYLQCALMTQYKLTLKESYDTIFLTRKGLYMKYILLFLSLFMLAGCQAETIKSDETHIKLKEDADIYLEGTSIFIEEGMTVSDVISFIESMDGSKQTYTGVSNDRTPKEKEEFYRYEYLLVTSESGSYRQYYQIIFID